MCQVTCSEHEESTQHLLDENNRIVYSRIWKQDTETTRIVLESVAHGEWRSIASYTSNFEFSIRYLNRCEGLSERFVSHLPHKVVQQMAMQDLLRNWRLYLKNYESRCVGTAESSQSSKLHGTS